MDKTPRFQVQAFGNYVLLDKVAVGGMAEIFKAKQVGVRGFEKIIVIKKILQHLSEDPEFVEMFEDEAKIAAQLTHANIVQIFELGEHNETLYIAMELVEGRNLRDVTRAIASKGMHLSIDQTVFIISAALRGLDYAHRKKTLGGESLNIVHRDISPQNIALSYEGEVKILDFGIAKAASKISQTEAGVLKGKFSYMSPEQASGRQIDQSTDVYALGVILHELLTSTRLFKSETDLETLEKVKIGNVPPPSQKNPNVPSALDDIALKALSRNPAKRFSSAGEMLSELNRFTFEQGMNYSAQDLSMFMTTLFQESIAAEKERLTEALAFVPEAINSSESPGKTNITFKADPLAEPSFPRAVVEVEGDENTVTGYREPSSSRFIRQVLLGIVFIAALSWVVLLSTKPTELPPKVESLREEETLESPTDEKELVDPPTPEPTEAPTLAQELDVSDKPQDDLSLKDFFGGMEPTETAPKKEAEDKIVASKKDESGFIIVYPPFYSIVDFYIDDRLIGTAPGPKARELKLAAGSYKLKCVQNNKPSQAYVQQFELKENQRLELFCDKGESI